MLDKEFVPYQESLELKELGFNEPCICAFYQDGQTTDPFPTFVIIKDVTNSKIAFGTIKCTRPTYSQAFRWFREKYGLYHHIVPEFYTKSINFNWQILWYLPEEEWTNHVISDGTGLYGDNGEYPTQEEAELACLKKLIEIVKK